MATGRHQLKEREEFNEWFHSTGLVVVVWPSIKSVEIGIGVIQGSRLKHFAAASEFILSNLKEPQLKRAYLDDLEQLQTTGAVPGDWVDLDEIGFMEGFDEKKEPSGRLFHITWGADD